MQSPDDQPMPPPAETPSHSITSSARTMIEGGIVMPSALAVLRLITSLNLLGCSTGRSARQLYRSKRITVVGGCLCRQVRYQVDVDPLWICHCHCGRCRKHT